MIGKFPGRLALLYIIIFSLFSTVVSNTQVPIPFFLGAAVGTFILCFGGPFLIKVILNRQGKEVNIYNILHVFVLIHLITSLPQEILHYFSIYEESIYLASGTLALFVGAHYLRFRINNITYRKALFLLLYTYFSLFLCVMIFSGISI